MDVTAKIPPDHIKATQNVVFVIAPVRHNAVSADFTMILLAKGVHQLAENL